MAILHTELIHMGNSLEKQNAITCSMFIVLFIF